MNDDKQLDVIVGEIESLLVDRSFHSLERDSAESNVFEIIGRSWDELTHSRMLTWLLNPNESHGLGTGFIGGFLLEAAKIASDRLAKNSRLKMLDFGEMMRPIFIEAISFSEATIQPEYSLNSSRRPDIVLWSDRSGNNNWLCIIENKIGALEGPDQTKDYYNSSKTAPLSRYYYRLFIYLTPTGSPALSPHFVPVSYKTVLDVLRSIPDDRYSQVGLIVTAQYMRCLEGTIMKQDKFHETCREIYRKHSRAIDTLKSYGSSSLLAARIKDRVLDGVMIEAQISEEWSWSSGSNWIALWPSKWPTKRGYYPAYYGIWSLDDKSCFDKVKIGLGFDGPDGESIKALAKANGYVSIAESVSADTVREVDHATEEGVRKMMSLIKQTYALVDEAAESFKNQRI